MEQLIGRLTELLDAETVIYEEILKLSKSKTDNIVEGKISELEEKVKFEQGLVAQIIKLETEREKIVGDVAGRLNLDEKTLTISKLIKKLEKDKKTKLEESYKRITKTLEELKNVNDLNSKLIKNSLDYIEFSVNLISNASNFGSNNYGGSGKPQEGHKKNLFDLKL
jgi:flagellar biosynthesis/type III secretory pathway chaperone